MSEMLKIIYRGFWDVPRMFFVKYNDKLYLFDSEFKDDIDDYDPYYEVYLMPNSFSKDLYNLRISWENIHLMAIRHIGNVSVDSVQFGNVSVDSVQIDPSLSKTINSSVFEVFQENN